MKKLDTRIERIIKGDTDKLDISVWENYINDDGEKKNRILASFELPTRVLSTFNQQMYSFEEDMESGKHEDDCICENCLKANRDAYDGSTRQAMDEVERENLNAIIRDQKSYE